MEFTINDLAVSWNISDEAVRKYVSEIRSLPDPEKSSLVRMKGRNILITEEGRKWIEDRREGIIASPRQKDSEQKRISELEAQLDQSQKELEDRSRRLDDAVLQAGHIEETLRKEIEAIKEMRSLDQQRAEAEKAMLLDRIHFLEDHIEKLTASLQAQQTLMLADRRRSWLYRLFHREETN